MRGQSQNPKQTSECAGGQLRLGLMPGSLLDFIFFFPNPILSMPINHVPCLNLQLRRDVSLSLNAYICKMGLSPPNSGGQCENKTFPIKPTAQGQLQNVPPEEPPPPSYPGGRVQLEVQGPPSPTPTHLRSVLVSQKLDCVL